MAQLLTMKCALYALLYLKMKKRQGGDGMKDYSKTDEFDYINRVWRIGMEMKEWK